MADVKESKFRAKIKELKSIEGEFLAVSAALPPWRQKEAFPSIQEKYDTEKADFWKSFETEEEKEEFLKYKAEYEELEPTYESIMRQIHKKDNDDIIAKRGIAYRNYLKDFDNSLPIYERQIGVSTNEDKRIIINLAKELDSEGILTIEELKERFIQEKKRRKTESYQQKTLEGLYEEYIKEKKQGNNVDDLAASLRTLLSNDADTSVIPDSEFTLLAREIGLDKETTKKITKARFEKKRPLVAKLSRAFGYGGKTKRTRNKKTKRTRNKKTKRRKNK
jgi:hypothetical protein